MIMREERFGVWVDVASSISLSHGGISKVFGGVWPAGAYPV